MSNIVGTLNLNGIIKYSSSGTKTAISGFNGISASIFRICANYCINP